MVNIRSFIVVLFMLCVNFVSSKQYVPSGIYKTAMYMRIFELEKINDDDWINNHWNYLSQYIAIDKIYLEVYRDGKLADINSIKKAKQFFQDKGVKVSAGIATVEDENNNYRTFCYSDINDIKTVSKIIKIIASNFDEIIFDDFFFINCKCDKCIKAKGNLSWSQYRLDLMKKISEQFVSIAKNVNPNIITIVKFPNWYEHYSFLGYNLNDEPRIFDYIYTGSETRDPKYNPQHLQTYQSYSIVRYLENVAKEKNAGTWVDPYYRGNIDRYKDQLILSLLAKPKELTLFCTADLIEDMDKYDYSKYYGTIAPVAANALFYSDVLLPKLGNPIGVAAYKPVNSSGEDYIHNFLGMMGIPIEMTPNYPEDADVVFLAESSNYDSNLLNKMKESLIKGKDIVITSGLLKCLNGINDILDIKYSSNKVEIDNIMLNNNIYGLEKKVIFPEIEFPTNEAWKLISGYSSELSYPLLLMGYYGKGHIYVLNIPDNKSDLYLYPKEVISYIKSILLNKRINIISPSKIASFYYDNNTVVVYSMLDYPQSVTIRIDAKNCNVNDLMSSEDIVLKNINGDSYECTFTLLPHSFKAFNFNF